MYIDSLTIAALVVFFIFFALFIKHCVFNICGMPHEIRENCKQGVRREDRS
jgi:hypothetical protein